MSSCPIPSPERSAILSSPLSDCLGYSEADPLDIQSIDDAIRLLNTAAARQFSGPSYH
jgi:hypothetical protein